LGTKNPDTNKRSEAWQKAVQDYESSMKLDPQDADAKFNHDFVKKKLEELKQQQQKKDEQKNIQPSEAAKRAKAQADEAVKQREYPKALEIMQKQLEQDETTAYFSDYINRLKEVTGVQGAAQH
jgi:tetratricopeptide (TPR) repeat protein